MDFTTQARFEQRFVIVGDEETQRNLSAIGRHAEELSRASESSQAKVGASASAAGSSLTAMGAAAAAAAHTAGQGLDEVLESIDSIEGAADTAGDALQNFALAAGAAVAVFGAKALADEAAAGAYEIQRLAWEMGVTVEAADTLGDAMLAAGVTTDATGAAMARWAQANRLVASGAAELPREMEAWGRIGKEALSSFPEALARVAEEVANARTEQEKLIISTAFFGEAGRRMLPLLAQGPAALREAASGMGAFYNADIVNRSNEYRIHMLQAADAIDDMKTAVAVKLYPLIERMADRALPVMEAGATAAATALEFASEHAIVIEGALAGAAAHFARMAVMSSAGGLASLAKALSSPAGLAAGVGAGLFALGDWLVEDLRSSGPSAGPGWMEQVADFAEQAAHTARVEEARAAASASASKAAEKEADALKMLSKISTLTGDQLQTLGYSASQLVSDFKSGGQQIRLAGFQVKAAALGQKATEAEEDVELLRRASGYAERMRELRRKGESFATLESRLTQAEAEARAIKTPAGDGRTAYGLGGLSTEQRQELEAARYALRTLRLAEAEAERAKLTKLLEAGKPLVQNTFNGPINNTLDLRGEDPDRVTFALTEGLAKMAVQRTVSRFTPVGL